MKQIHKLFLSVGWLILTGMLFLTSCTKEGPAGANGKDGAPGAPGADGKDANETCKQCHTKSLVDSIAVEFQLAKHNWGVAAFEEAGNTTCAPCHEQRGFVYVCDNNTSSAFTFNETTKKWVNNYMSDAENAIGAITCYTCHNSLHTTYGTADLALTTTAPVPLNMWGGIVEKTINLAQDNGSSNLCVKCHQPRPLTCGNDPAGRLLNYDSVLNFPLAMMYDSTTGAKNTMLRPSYRMHIHYGAVGAVYAGIGAIEYTGLNKRTYENSPHTSVASCKDCHMAKMTGVAGGHAFSVRNGIESTLTNGTTWNFNGCNVDGCHAQTPIDANSDKFKGVRTEIKGYLDQLAAKINACGGGTDILHKESSASNLWAGITTNNYDGYLDIYNSSANPNGYWRDPYNTSPTNLAKPKFPSLLMVQTGALINFQFCLREYSLGIHNTQYVKSLLINTIDELTKAGL